MKETLCDQPTVAVIGFGAMARSLRNFLARGPSGIRLEACLLPSASPAHLAPGMPFFRTVEELIAARPQLVVECASYAAVHETVPQILKAGISVVIASIGALGDPATAARLEAAAKAGAAKAIAISGAIGGLDVLRAAALAGLDSVTYIGRKPPSAWKGTPAETHRDLDGLTEATVLYEGTAREAARDYPKNTNVTAAVALAGVGFEATKVKLVADPTSDANTHELKATGAFGDFRIVLNNRALPENPKTSWLAALSVEQACCAISSFWRYEPLDMHDGHGGCFDRRIVLADLVVEERPRAR